MNQPSNTCGSLIPANHPPILQVDHFHDIPTQETTQLLQSPPGPPMDTLSDDSYNQVLEDFNIYSDEHDLQLFQSDLDPPFAGNVEYHPCIPQVFPGGRTFMDDFFADKYGLVFQSPVGNLYKDWQLDWITTDCNWTAVASCDQL